jgi:alpha-beta hydrolase superfamily lysophospholipase
MATLAAEPHCGSGESSTLSVRWVHAIGDLPVCLSRQVALVAHSSGAHLAALYMVQRRLAAASTPDARTISAS